MPRHSPLLCASLLAAVALTGCSSPVAPAGQAAEPSDEGHGRVAGAAEVSEPQLALTTIDPRGVVRSLDLLDESVVELGEVPAPSQVSTDGRYLFASGDDGVGVVDSGRWTWDHVDHFHYYLAEPRILGVVPGEGPATVATTNSSTTGGTGLFFPSSGTAVLLDTESLSRGRLVESMRVAGEPHDGMIVPVGRFALVTEAAEGVATSVAVYDEAGKRVAGPSTECRGASGTITTRVGAVLGCADGALLATIVDDSVTIERIPYPGGAPAPAATEFHNREGRPTVAGLAGDDGIWLLDTRQRTWSLLPSPAPLAQVTAVDDEAQHVLALTRDGRVLVLDGGTGAVTAATDPLVAQSAPEATARPTLVADQQRAYLNAPAEGRLYEIDFADSARIAREFRTESAPAFLAETGR